MTLEVFYKHLETLKMPVTYFCFAEGKAPKPPYIVYFVPGPSNFSADGVVYSSFKDVVIELYTTKKDPEKEKKIETLLHSIDLYFEQSEDYIESEKLIRQTYELNIL